MIGLSISLAVINVLLFILLWYMTCNSLSWERKFIDADEMNAGLRAKLNQVERIPLRTKCRCGHDAYTHGRYGCDSTVAFVFDCACNATQAQVMYDPAPMVRLR